MLTSQRTRWYAALLVVAALGCGSEEPGGKVDAGLDVLVDPGVEVSAIDALPDAPDTGPDVASLPDAEDALADVADVADTVDVPPDLGPPPLPTAPDHFYQLRLEGVVLNEEGESDQLEVELPAGTTSVFVMVTGERDDAFYTLKTVVTPKPFNELVVKGAGDAVCIPCTNRVSAAQKLASFLIPNDPAIEVGGGEWLFRIRATGILKTVMGTSYPPISGTCDVTFLARTEPIPQAGELTVHLHFTGSGGLTAATAPEDPRMMTALARFAEVYASVGITLTVGGYHDVPGVDEDPTLLDLESTLGQPNDLSKLLLLGQAEDLNALNIFFVNSIYQDGDFAGGATVLGIAAGVPGPAFVGPSYRSGVVVATFDSGGEEDYLGNVLAHEAGHYLGLYHSTEKNPVYHDTLDDTAEGESANLMYWAYAADHIELSPDQATVMRSHPLVLPVEP